MKKQIILLFISLFPTIAFSQLTTHPESLKLGSGTGNGYLETRFQDDGRFKFLYSRWQGGWEWSTTSSSGEVNLMALYRSGNRNYLKINSKASLLETDINGNLDVNGDLNVNSNYLKIGNGSGTGVFRTDFGDHDVFTFYYPRWNGGWEWNTNSSNGNLNLMKLHRTGNRNYLDVNAAVTVDGRIRSEEVKVEIIDGPDYVFEPDYELRTLKETKEYISENKHLPEIPTAKEMEANGVDLGDMNMRLLKKIEELTLYQIELLERLEKQQEEINELKKKID